MSKVKDDGKVSPIDWKPLFKTDDAAWSFIGDKGRPSSYNACFAQRTLELKYDEWCRFIKYNLGKIGSGKRYNAAMIHFDGWNNLQEFLERLSDETQKEFTRDDVELETVKQLLMRKDSACVSFLVVCRETTKQSIH